MYFFVSVALLFYLARYCFKKSESVCDTCTALRASPSVCVSAYLCLMHTSLCVNVSVFVYTWSVCVAFAFGLLLWPCAPDVFTLYLHSHPFFNIFSCGRVFVIVRVRPWILLVPLALFVAQPLACLCST